MFLPSRRGEVKRSIYLLKSKIAISATGVINFICNLSKLDAVVRALSLAAPRAHSSLLDFIC